MGKTEVEVFVGVVCDEETEKAQKIQACTRIQKHIAKLKGVKEVYYTGQPDTADITVFAQWDLEDIRNKVLEITQIEGVKQAEARILIPV